MALHRFVPPTVLKADDVVRSDRLVDRHRRLMLLGLRRRLCHIPEGLVNARDQHRRPASWGRDGPDRNLLGVREAATEDRDLAPGWSPLGLLVQRWRTPGRDPFRRSPNRHDLDA